MYAVPPIGHPLGGGWEKRGEEKGSGLREEGREERERGRGKARRGGEGRERMKVRKVR